MAIRLPGTNTSIRIEMAAMAAFARHVACLDLTFLKTCAGRWNAANHKAAFAETKTMCN